MIPKKMLIIDSKEMKSYRDMFREFEGDLLITYSERTRVMHIPSDYDIYLFNTADVDLDAIWKLKRESPECKIYGVNGGCNREGKTLEHTIMLCMHAIYGCLSNELAELIYKESQKVDINTGEER